ncbi:MAG: hypothetical protein V4577_24940 [Bacteroidota bacterium]
MSKYIALLKDVKSDTDIWHRQNKRYILADKTDGIRFICSDGFKTHRYR